MAYESVYMLYIVNEDKGAGNKHSVCKALLQLPSS
jgi:hypothetical protein